MSDTNGKALIPIGTQAPPISLTEMMTIGKILASSGFFADVRGEAQAVAKILAGQEAGFGPMAAMTGIHIVKGKIVIGANLMAAKVKSSGRYNYRIKRLDDAGCVLEFTENGKPVGESTFTLEDATKAGLGQGDNWKHYPRNMLFARAISNGVRWYCADVFNGTTVYTPEEMGDDRLPEMAVVEDVTVSDVTPAQIAQNSERESVREAMEGAELASAVKAYQAPSDPPPDAMRRLWEARWQEARQLGIDHPGVEHDCDRVTMQNMLNSLTKAIKEWHAGADAPKKQGATA